MSHAITEAMIEAAMRETPFIPNENNRAWMVRALSAALALSAGQVQAVEAGEPCVICGQLHCDVCPAPAHPPVQVPVVKALTWEYSHIPHRTYPMWKAETIVGQYAVVDTKKTVEWCLDGKTQVHDTSSVEEAKAAAQSDYESRIRSALSPPAVPGEVEFERLGNINRDVVEQLQAGYSWTTRIAVGEWSPQSVQLYIKSDSPPLPASPEQGETE